MILKIRNIETGETSTLHRDVSTRHDKWVHGQLGTESEPDLQHFLDQCNEVEFFKNSPNSDSAGVFMDSLDAARELKYFWDDFNELPHDEASLNDFKNWIVIFGLKDLDYFNEETIKEKRESVWWSWHDETKQVYPDIETAEKFCDEWVKTGKGNGPW